MRRFCANCAWVFSSLCRHILRTDLSLYCYWMTSPSTSTRHAPHPGRIDPRRKVLRRTGSRCFPQPWTRCTPLKNGRSSIGSGKPQNYGVQKILGEFTKYNVQVEIDVTKEPHCTGSVRSALASGDAGERTQDRTVDNKEEVTAAPTRTSTYSW